MHFLEHATRKKYVQSFIILTFMRSNMKRFQKTFPIFATALDFQCFSTAKVFIWCFHVCQMKTWTSLSSKSALHIRFFPYLLTEPSGVHISFPLIGILPMYILVSAIRMIMKSSQILLLRFLYSRFSHVCERMWW